MGSITTLPVAADFGVPKQDDASVLVVNPANEVWHASEHDTQALRLVEIFAEVGKADYSTAGSIWRAIGNPNGSTPASAWQSIAALQSLASSSREAVILRQNEPSPTGRVYATWPALFSAVSAMRGRVEVFIDNTLAPCVIPSGTYAFSCSHLAFVGMANGTSFTIQEGAVISGPSLIEVNRVTMSWTGTTPVFTIPSATKVLFNIVEAGQIVGTASAGPLIDFTGTGQGAFAIRDELCELSTTGYEVVRAAVGAEVAVFPGPYSVMGSDVFRGAATIFVIGNSANLSQVQTTQTNLTVPLSIVDGATSSPVMAALHASAAARATEVVWRPGGVASGNVFTTWATAFDGIQTRRGIVRVVVDNSLAPAIIPAGAYAFACTELIFINGTSALQGDMSIAAGVTITGGTIRTLTIDGLDVLWLGTAAMWAATTAEQVLNLKRGATLTSDATASGVLMSNTLASLIVRMDDPLCSIVASGYELFEIGAAAAGYVYGELLCNLGSNTFRGAGNVFGLMNSSNGTTISDTHTNLTIPITIQDGFDFSMTPTLARLAAIETTVIWRPTEPSPSANIYDTWASLAAAIATKPGSITVICDHSLSSTFNVTAAAYPLACTEIRFVGWRNAPATIALVNGVSFTGGTIRSIVIDGVRLEWRGTGSPLIPTVTSTLYIDLYRGGVLGADNGNSAAMFTIDELAIVRLHDPQCTIEASNYEIFLITDTSLVDVRMSGLLTTVGNDFARSSGTGADDGAVTLYYDSGHGQTIPTSMANLNDPMTAFDAATFGTAYAAVYSPTSEDTNSASVSWTTQQRLKNILVGLATFTLNATLAQWPVGHSRYLANFSSGAAGVRVNVPVGHYLNDVLNGTTGTVGTAAVTDGAPVFTIRITREALDRWSW